MQFGKRKKNASLRAQRVHHPGQAQPDTEVHRKQAEPEPEREPEPQSSAPVSQSSENVRAPEPHEDGESDSTQRLLAALGNLEAQVEAAKTGVKKDTWSGQCMDQLIKAVELALEEDWADVVDVLTETARILETYRKAERQQECVSFLADSHEIMSGMVADLMVGGEVRANVLKRWDKRYQQALNEVAAAGLTLVKDDDSDEPSPHEPVERPHSREEAATGGTSGDSDAGEQAGPSKVKKSRTPAPRNGGAQTPDAEQSPFDIGDFQGDNGGGASTLAEDESSRLAELPGFDDDDPSSDGQSHENNADSAPANGDSMENPFDLAGWMNEDTDAGTEVQPPTFPMGGEDGEEEVDTASGNGAKAQEKSHEVSTSDDDMEFMLDSWSEALAELEQGPQDKQEEYLGDAEESVNLLEGLASQRGRWRAVEACHICQELLALISPPERPSERLIELAYAFCGAYAEAEDPEASTLTDWKAECQQFLEEARNTPAPEPAKPAEPVMLDHVRIEWETPSSDQPDAAAETKGDEDPDTEIEAGFQPEAEPGAGSEPEPPEDADGQAGLDPLAEAERLAEAVEGRVDAGGAAQPEPVMVNDTAERVEELPPVYIEAAVRTAMAMRGGGSPEQLLGVAMQAIARGEGESAKLLALRAAAMLAQTEAQRAETQLGEAEHKLEQGVRAIDHARQEVTEAEQAVNTAESSVSEEESALEECSRESARIVEQVTGLEGRISDLDAQIKALQEQREQEAQTLAQSQAELEKAREREREQQQRIEELKVSKKTAREQLEDARQRVKDLQQRRTEVENAMERAREALERRRSSMKDIEGTIAQVVNKEEGVSVDTGDLLF